jgi:RNA polymerase sigma factor (sigma-70 family)
MTNQGFDFDAELIKLLPGIRNYAAALMRKQGSGDDLMQDTLVRALRSRHTFSPGTNLKAWLYTILRNGFITTVRRKRLEQVPEGHDMPWPAAQDDAVALGDVSRLLQLLPPTQRRALLLVGANGHSYREAAAIAGARIGTVKSRVARARASLRLAFEPATPGGRLPALPDLPASPLYG